MESTDPTVIRSIAVSVEDVVAAAELNRTTSRRAALRVTPPYSGRMRARLHVERPPAEAHDSAPSPSPVHVAPDALLGDVPSYPRPADTEDELRDDPTASYTVERHHERHAAAVEEWRATVADAICEQATIDTPAGPCEVSVVTLGTSDEPLKRDERSE